VLDKDFQLKVIDFDSACKDSDTYRNYLGTENYRAPEARSREAVTNLYALDIYSMGIILFVLNAGFWPYNEGTILEDLLFKNQEKYWKNIDNIQRKRKEQVFSPELKSLFLSMTRKDIKDRATLSEIMNSSWFKEEIFNDEDLFSIMETKLCQAEM